HGMLCVDAFVTIISFRLIIIGAVILFIVIIVVIGLVIIFIIRVRVVVTLVVIVVIGLILVVVLFGLVLGVIVFVAIFCGLLVLFDDQRLEELATVIIFVQRILARSIQRLTRHRDAAGSRQRFEQAGGTQLFQTRRSEEHASAL